MLQGERHAARGNLHRHFLRLDLHAGRCIAIRGVHRRDAIALYRHKGYVSGDAGLSHVDADRAGCITGTVFYFAAVRTARGIGLRDNRRRYQPQRQQ